MAVVKKLELMRSLRVRGKYGKPNQFGNLWFGVSWYGDDNELSGIYRRHHKKGRVGCTRMVHYAPTNTQQPGQQAWRQVFADGRAAWGALTEEEKAVYNKQAVIYRLPGYAYFQKEYLREHRL